MAVVALLAGAPMAQQASRALAARQDGVPKGPEARADADPVVAAAGAEVAVQATAAMAQEAVEAVQATAVVAQETVAAVRAMAAAVQATEAAKGTAAEKVS